MAAGVVILLEKRDFEIILQKMSAAEASYAGSDDRKYRIKLQGKRWYNSFAYKIALNPSSVVVDVVVAAVVVVDEDAEDAVVVVVVVVV